MSRRRWFFLRNTVSLTAGVPSIIQQGQYFSTSNVGGTIIVDDVEVLVFINDDNNLILLSQDENVTILGNTPYYFDTICIGILILDSNITIPANSTSVPISDYILFGNLGSSINVDGIIVNLARDGMSNDITLTNTSITSSVTVIGGQPYCTEGVS